LSQDTTTAVGQVSADGQFRWDGAQWVPIARGEREPTPWTRPMQLAAAALLTAVAVLTVGATAIYYSHDAVKRTLDAAGTQIPQGTTEDQLISITIAGAIGFAVVVGLIELLGAVGAFFRWRWAFWYVFVLMCLGSLSALAGIAAFFQTTPSPLPKAVQVVNELLAVGAVAMLVWMIVGLVRYGPWAMKRPG
jgi:hypothetical protein